ncbi:DNA-methyltransferase [Sphingomonas sp. RB1R13]|uniref:DNA-methyltransferase n=1 Tax=Sphingomonas sp. RB1R13 TaxID=3096159 RepID=UPI002FCA44FA
MLNDTSDYYKVTDATDPLIEIIEGNCLQIMREMATGSVPLIVCSPPFNIRNSSGGGFRSKSSGNWANSKLPNGYGLNSDDHPREHYKRWLRACTTEMIRLIPDDGAIFMNLKERMQNGLRETPEEIIGGLPVRQRITWERAGSNNHTSGCFLPNSEIIYFFAGPNFEVAKECRRFGTVWNIPQQRGSPHPAPYPIELPRRCLRSAPDKRLVLDPFSGWGTTGLACIEQGRNFVGIELEKKYIQQSFERLAPELWRTDALLRMRRHSSAGHALDWSEFDGRKVLGQKSCREHKIAVEPVSVQTGPVIRKRLGYPPSTQIERVLRAAQRAGVEIRNIEVTPEGSIRVSSSDGLGPADEFERWESRL